MPEPTKVTLAILKEQVHSLKTDLTDHKEEMESIEETVDKLSVSMAEIDKMISFYKGMAWTVTTLAAIVVFFVKDILPWIVKFLS